jgi:hypothetical protein
MTFTDMLASFWCGVALSAKIAVSGWALPIGSPYRVSPAGAQACIRKEEDVGATGSKLSLADWGRRFHVANAV